LKLKNTKPQLRTFQDERNLGRIIEFYKIFNIQWKNSPFQVEIVPFKPRYVFWMFE